jgi:hypothetical protein
MIINFYLRFGTSYGQSLSIIGNFAGLGNYIMADALKMQYVNQDFWRGTIEVEPGVTGKIQYKYVLTYADGHRVIEGEQNRVIDVKKYGRNNIQTVDTWNHEGAFENVYFTSPFQKCCLRNMKGSLSPNL